MNQRNIILLVVAALIAGFTVFGLKSRMNSGETVQTVKPAASRILIAKKDIPAGGFVRSASDLDWAAWPADSLLETHIRENAEAITGFDGAVARRAVKAGEPVMANTLIKPGAGGFLSAVLEPGKRAVSIAIANAAFGNAGFVFPGDYVDLIVTNRMKVSAQGAEEEAVTSQTFIENVRVVAVDQLLDNPENKAILAKTITVEVTPKQAEKVAIAAELGKVTFALRAISNSGDAEKARTQAPLGIDAQIAGQENPPEAPEQNWVDTAEHNAPKGGFTTDLEVNPALNRTDESNARVRVFRGDTVESLEFYKGKY